MNSTPERTEWRQRLISELLKHNIIYGKLTIDDIVNNAKKIEEFVFGSTQPKSSADSYKGDLNSA